MQLQEGVQRQQGVGQTDGDAARRHGDGVQEVCGGPRCGGQSRVA